MRSASFPKNLHSDVRSRLVTSVCCLQIQYFTRELIQLGLYFDVIVNLPTIFSEEEFLLVVPHVDEAPSFADLRVVKVVRFTTYTGDW